MIKNPRFLSLIVPVETPYRAEGKNEVMSHRPAITPHLVRRKVMTNEQEDHTIHDGIDGAWGPDPRNLPGPGSTPAHQWKTRYPEYHRS
jgi:hypothetical protein